MTADHAWGRSKNKKAKYVHLFVNGKACCGQGPRMDLQHDTWDPENPGTCPHCRKIFSWMERGFFPKK